MEYCTRNSIHCEWISIEDFPNTKRSLIPINLLGRFVALIFGFDIVAVSWAFRVIALILALRFAVMLRKRSCDRLVAMDAVASWAVKPDLLIVHGALADEVARQISPGFAFRLGCLIESQGYRVAGKVVAVDPALQARISRFHRSEVNMIPNPVDLKHFTIRDRDKMKRRLGFSTRRRLIAFAGNFPERYVELIPKWRFDVERLGFSTAHLQGIPYEQMPLYLNAADLVVSMGRLAAFMRIAIEALACGTPVISNNSPLATYSSQEHLVENIRTFRWPKSRTALRKKALPYNSDFVCQKLLELISTTPE
jgi:hypothetical protein